MRIREGFPSLVKTIEEAEEYHNQGHIITEVGLPIPANLKAYAPPFLMYPLRKPRKNQIPRFMFGKMYLGDAFSAFMPRQIQVPTIGTRVVIHPLVTAGQINIFNMFNYICCDCVWILHVPAPLGTAVYLEVFAGELDGTTITRGIKWKPAAVNTIAFLCPWSSDLSVLPLSKPRLGQPGGSLIIHTLENNTLETVNTPLNILAYCCVVNVNLLGYKLISTVGVDVPSLNFTPQTSTKPSAISYYVPEGEEQSDESGTIELEVEGGSDIKQQQISIESVPIQPPVETPIKETPVEMDGVTKSSIDIGQLGTKWYNFMNIELRGPPTQTWTNLNIDPYKDITLRQPGESMSIPFRRNVWTTGSNINGYITQLICQINIPRPPQISGVLEVIDSSQASSRYLVSFGSRVEIPIMLEQLVGEYNSSTKPRQYTNPWVRTDNSINVCRYRLIAINRTADIANLNIRVMLRPAYARFNVPRKPISSTSTNLDDIIGTLYKVCGNRFAFKNWVQQSARFVIKPYLHPPKTFNGFKVEDNGMYVKDGRHMYIPEAEWQADFNESGLTDNSNFITPLIGERPEQFSVQTDVGVEEDINLDAFPVLCFSGSIDIGKITTIPINLPNIIDHFDDTGSENPITQKFLRFANIVPKGVGAFGPVIGSYTIHFRLPTSVAGEVLHNCLPGDMTDEVALRIFGLSSLASIAGTALSSIGGPLVNGIVNTAAPVISGAVHAIGGKSIGTLADVAINGAKGLISSVLPTPGEAAIQGAATNSISGDLPISRFPQFVKYVKENFEKDPIFPTLMIELRNFYEDGKLKTGKVPVSIFANMRECINVERNIFNRSIFPTMDPPSEDLYLDIDRIPFVFEHFIRHKATFVEGTLQNRYFKNFIMHIDNQLEKSLVNSGRINLSAIRADIHYAGLTSRFLRRSKIFQMCAGNPQK